jgi:excisionase family DNA binding protein
MSKDDEVDTLTVPQAAREAGITRQTVWGAIKRGTLQATKHGRDWLIARSEWERYRRDIGKSGEIDSLIDSQERGSDSGEGAALPHQDSE